ncbi:MAG: hypothetical protein C6I01_04410, partial [Epsilonproteobacteria bacterium]|nr:hypothetical protein [Campylobacterota bacterium]
MGEIIPIYRENLASLWVIEDKKEWTGGKIQKRKRERKRGEFLPSLFYSPFKIAPWLALVTSCRYCLSHRLLSSFL